MGKVALTKWNQQKIMKFCCYQWKKIKYLFANRFTIGWKINKILLCVRQTIYRVTKIAWEEKLRNEVEIFEILLFDRYEITTKKLPNNHIWKANKQILRCNLWNISFEKSVTECEEWTFEILRKIRFFYFQIESKSSQWILLKKKEMKKKSNEICQLVCQRFHIDVPIRTLKDIVVVE